MLTLPELRHSLGLFLVQIFGLCQRAIDSALIIIDQQAHSTGYDVIQVDPGPGLSVSLLVKVLQNDQSQVCLLCEMVHGITEYQTGSNADVKSLAVAGGS